ncbi:MAG: apolipoprotein N-acyltransferase [Sandaracinaceae bacterium]|nr:apolipoprotein N-acyltransferase [Sandaracinaceae bacterium]
MAMGGAPFEAWGVAWAGLVLMVMLVEQALDSLDSTLSKRHVTALGLAFGCGAHALSTSWLVELVTEHTPIPWLFAWGIAFLGWVIQSIPFAATCFLRSTMDGICCRCGTTRGRIGLLAWPIAGLVAFDGVPMVFPWRVSHSQLGALPWVQLAEIGGEPLLDALMWVTAWDLQRALRRRKVFTGGTAGWLAAICLVAPTAWGTWRLEVERRQREKGPGIQVGAVQHAISVRERMDPSKWNEQLALSRSLGLALDAQQVDVVVWPESTFPWVLSQEELNNDVFVKAWSRGFRSHLVFGAITKSKSGLHNSVIGMHRSQLIGIANKFVLMPFTERIPFREQLTILNHWVGPGLRPGPPLGAAIRVQGRKWGILNCYEDLFPNHVRNVVRTWKPSILSNHTNDAWFGQTNALRLHHFLARMRSIETRRDLVRATNTGITSLIASTGEVIASLPPFQRGVLKVEAKLSEEITFWVRWGDRLTPASWMALLAWVFFQKKAGRCLAFSSSC